ncbi:MAG: GNAT family N-acetyltransferase [Deltaproteobacteria bacterium]|nr:MAG: GNAT family N-acetyltransferase [Deltaproteobacteria bacterium]
MNLAIAHRREIGQKAWDAFVDRADEAWLWHLFPFQDAFATWPGRSDLSFAVVDASRAELLAVVPLQLVKRTKARIVTLNLLESLGGPACADGLPEKTRQQIRQAALDHLLALARQYRALAIDLALPPMAPAYRGERCPRVNPLLFLGCDNTLTQTYAIDLRRTEEELWQGLSGNCRNMVKRAEKEGVTVREAGSPADLECYYRMHLETYRRTGALPHPFAYFQQIWQNFTSRGYSHIFLAELKGEVVAAANVGAYKGAMIYWTGASKTGLPSPGVNNLLQWHAIRYARSHGFEWYESGEAFPNLKEGKLKGLNDFKKSFGGELYPFYRGLLVIRKNLHLLYTLYHSWRGTHG